MARSAVAPERFVGQFGDVRSAHHDRHSGGANGVGHAIRLGDHSGHRADADQSDVFFSNEPRDLGFVHRLRVAVDQQHFVAGGRQGLEEKHPEVRHEIAVTPLSGL